MRPKTLAHDWCADANCETCSHRHKAESQPMRPNPAVGQVWRTKHGIEYVIGYAEIDRQFRRVFVENAEIGTATHKPDTLLPTDVFIGQFAGFKVQEGTT